MKSLFKLKSHNKMNKSTLGTLVFASITALAAASAQAQDIYVSDLYGGAISEYTISGNSVATPLTSDSSLGDPFGMVISGNDLYVDNYASDTISEYNATTGASMGTIITNPAFDQPADMLLNGDDLYVANIGGSNTPNNGSVYEYNILTGTMIGSGPLISTGLNYSEYLALSANGQDLYVSSWTGVNEYNAATGALIGGKPLISGQENVSGIAVNGNDLYVVDRDNGTVTLFNATTGKEIGKKPLISGLDSPRDVVYYNGDLYVSDVGTNSIIEYNATTGQKIGSSCMLICSDDPYSFIINADPPTSAVPEPSTWAMLLGGLLLFVFVRRVRSRA